jgi:peptide/nickel transport system permease protein
VVIVIGITMVIFGMLHVISGSPGRAVLGLQATPAAVAAWNKANGYDSPLVVQYWHYLTTLLHGHLGYSYKLNQSVNALLAHRAPRSALLSGAALTLAIGLAVPVGIFQAVRRNSVADNLLTTGAFIGYSMPSFFLGLILIQVLALGLKWFPTEASQAPSVAGILANPRAMVLPIVTLTLVQLAHYSRFMRSSAIDVLAQDYVKVARAKGLPERLVLTRHLLRNACLPVVTLIGLSLPLLLAGTLITETVFNYPGTGLLFFNALQNEDYPILLAYTLVGGVLTVLGNLLADISLTVADPRIRLA